MKILVADDHALFRSGLQQLISELDSNIQIIEAENHQQAFEIIQENSDIDIALLDLSMPDSDGLTALAKITQKFPMLPAVVLSASESKQDMIAALKAGAMGFIQKSESGPVILNAIRLVLAGGVYVPPALVDDNHRVLSHSSLESANLSTRQLDIVKYVVEGKSNKEIARELSLSVATVKSHLREIFKLMNVKSRTQAAMKAEKLGIFN